MTRMEAIRRQYQGSEAARPQQATGGCPYPARPRNRFWILFWAVILLALVGGFLYARQPILEKARALWGANGSQEASLLSSTGAEAHQGAHQGAAEGAKVSDEAFLAYVNPTLAEMNQLCEYVRNAPNVKDNLQYAEIMRGVQFLYEGDNNLVNAYAGLKQLDKSKDEMTRVIIYLAGAARFGRIAALAVAAELSGDKGAGKRFVAVLRTKDLTDFSDATAARLVNEAGLAAALANEAVVTKAKSVSAGLMLGIIAHEAGHQALGHVLNTKSVSNEISRNQERESDSFASSVIASSPFGEYILVGTLFWHYALAQQQGDNAVATTHPLSKERFENFVRANEELAASMGITVAANK